MDALHRNKATLNIKDIKQQKKKKKKKAANSAYF